MISDEIFLAAYIYCGLSWAIMAAIMWCRAYDNGITAGDDIAAIIVLAPILLPIIAVVLAWEHKNMAHPDNLTNLAVSTTKFVWGNT